MSVCWPDGHWTQEATGLLRLFRHCKEKGIVSCHCNYITAVGSTKQKVKNSAEALLSKILLMLIIFTRKLSKSEIVGRNRGLSLLEMFDDEAVDSMYEAPVA